MNIEQHITELTGRAPVRLSQALVKHDVLLMENSAPIAFNSALDHLNPGGAIFFVDVLPLVHHLVKLGFPVIIHRDFRDLACFMPLEDEPLESYKIDHREIPKTLDKYLVQWLEWYNDYANKNIICEPRFWDHLIWNRFHPDEQRFLP